MKRRNPLDTVTVHDKPRTRHLLVRRWQTGRGAQLSIGVGHLGDSIGRQDINLSKREARRVRDAIDAWLKRECAR